MLKKYISKGLMIAGAGLAALACTDLQEEIFSNIASENYYQDRNSIEAALVRPFEHGHWCGWDGDRWILQELTADQFVWTQKGKHGYDDGQWIRAHGHTWTEEERIINGGWVGPYQGIGQCTNYIADFMGLDFVKYGLTDADKQNYIAQLRTLRSWFYLFLIDYFRSVPIPMDTKTKVGQSSPQEVFAYIEKELKESIPALPKETMAGRFGQAGGAALLARLYLNAEVWIGQNRYADARKVAQDIIDGT